MDAGSGSQEDRGSVGRKGGALSLPPLRGSSYKLENAKVACLFRALLSFGPNPKFPPGRVPTPLPFASNKFPVDDDGGAQDDTAHRCALSLSRSEVA